MGARWERSWRSAACKSKSREGKEQREGAASPPARSVNITFNVSFISSVGF